MARATRSLPVPLSPVMSTVRSLPCIRWIWSATRCIAALAQTKPGSSGSSCRSMTIGRGFDRPVARLAEIETLAQHRAERAEPLSCTGAEAAAALETTAKRGPSTRRARALSTAMGAPDVPIERSARRRPAPGASSSLHRRTPARATWPGPGWTNSDRCLAVAGLEQRGGAFTRQQCRHRRRVHDPPDQRIVAVHLDADVAAGAGGRAPSVEREARFGKLGRRAERFENRARRRSGSAWRATARRPEPASRPSSR